MKGRTQNETNERDERIDDLVRLLVAANNVLTVDPNHVIATDTVKDVVEKLKKV